MTVVRTGDLGCRVSTGGRGTEKDSGEEIESEVTTHDGVPYPSLRKNGFYLLKTRNVGLRSILRVNSEFST